MINKLSSVSTDPVPAENLMVKWPNVLEIQKTLDVDEDHKLLPTFIKMAIFAHSPNGGNKEEIASGKIDMSQFVRNGLTSDEIKLSSNILDSMLSYDLEIIGGELFIEARHESDEGNIQNLPKIDHSFSLGWFNYKHDLDMIETDVFKLIDVATRA